MPSLEQRNGRFRIVFRLGGKRFSRALKTTSERAAASTLARLEDSLRRAELGLLTIPDDVDLVTFLLSDGQVAARPAAPTIRTLKQLLDAYGASIPEGGLEASTIQGINIHARHLQRVLGPSCPVQSLDTHELQRYVHERSRAKGRRGNLSPATIAKELVTLRTAWNWGIRCGYLKRPYPGKGVRFPKTAEKPPFRTFAEIERIVGRGGLTTHEEAELWDALFLTRPEIDELLAYVKEHARHSFIYPLFVFAAHTGARRSEMLRSRVEDIDLDARTAIIREKKRARGRRTNRRVPLSPLLHAVLREWLDGHPGGLVTFCHTASVPRSKKNDRAQASAVTPDEVHDHLKRTLAGSEKWKHLRGWHVFRHSFCSNAAASGVDQRVIDAWVGHQTDEMVRRYRHLIPDQEQKAIRLVFA